MELDAISLILLALAIPASFIVSAAAGLGGSLILVPAMLYNQFFRDIEHRIT